MTKQRPRKTRSRTRAAAKKRNTAKAIPHAPYAIFPRKTRRGHPTLMIADPAKLAVPTLTEDISKAMVFAGRQAANKHMHRRPHLIKKFWYRRVA